MIIRFNTEYWGESVKRIKKIPFGCKIFVVGDKKYCDDV
jgi:hypothetical protein